MKLLVCASCSFVVRHILLPTLVKLARAGVSVFVITANDGDALGDLRDMGIAVRFIAFKREISPIYDVGSLWRLWRLIRELKPDVCEVTTPKMGLLGGVAAWAARVPCRVYTVRGLRVETTRGIKRKVIVFAEKLACLTASKVLCISRSVLDAGVQLRLFRRGKACVIGRYASDGIDIDRYARTYSAQENDIIRAELRIPKTARVIGFVGRLTRDKGIPELVQAFELIKHTGSEVVLIVIGRFEPGDAVPEWVANRIRTDESIRFIGYQSDPVPYYQLMDVLALPTHREGLGNVLLEAGAAEVPVVSTKATGVVDAVEDGVTGVLVPVGDVTALAAALTRVIMDAEFAKDMGRRARIRVINHFDLTVVARALMEFYETLVQNSSREQRGGPLNSGRWRGPVGPWA